MASLAAGNYNIVSVADTSKALSLPAATRSGVRDGALATVESRNWAESQIFSVSQRADNTWQVLNRLTGKSLSAFGATPAAGNPIGIWTDNDDFTQQWDVSEAGTVSIEGTSYTAYYLTLSGTTLRLASSNGNAVLAAKSTAAAQKWAFVPIPELMSGGVYELVSFADRRRCLAIGASALNDGAPACIYARMGINDQKWYLEDTGDGWHIRNVNSGKILCVNYATAAAGQQVVQWEDVQGVVHGLWKPFNSRTEELDGFDRKTVEFGIDNGETFVLTSILSNGNAAITTRESLDAEYFILVPTWAYDARISAPYDADAVAAVGNEAHYDATAPYGASMDFRFTPTWRVPDALATSGPTSFQIRTRSRAMGADTSAWGAWGAWSEWESASITRIKDRYWLTQGITATITDASKLAQVEYEVRTCIAVDGSLRYGGSASYVETCYPVPQVRFAEATLDSEGLAIHVSPANGAAQYDCGSVALTIESIAVGSGTEYILSEPYSASVDGGEGWFNIPYGKLTYLPYGSPNPLMSIVRIGTDQKDALEGPNRLACLISFDAAQVHPTVTAGEGRTLALTPPSGYGSNQAWIVVDGRRVDIPANADGTFDVLYPFGVPYSLCVTGTDGETYYVYRSDRTADERGCHAFNWAGGYVLVELREGEALTTDDTIEAEYDAHILDARPFETVTFAPTVKHHFTVDGAVIDSRTESKRGDFSDVAGRHVTYRSPAGDVCRVAIVSVSRTAHKQWTELKLTLVREG